MLAATAVIAGPAGAATRSGEPGRSPAAPAAQGYRESHLWVFGRGTVLGTRFPVPQPIHGLPTGQHVVGAAFGDVTDSFLLGNGTVWELPTPKPHEVPGLSGIAAISEGPHMLYALSSTGDVYSWTGTGSASPVTGVSGVTSVTNGYALESNGTVWALGGTVPMQVALPAPVTQVSSNQCGSTSYALTSSGLIYAWGGDQFGQLGNGTISSTGSTTPVLVHRVRDASQVIGGCFDAYAILKGTGSVMAWGRGSQGQLGNGHRFISSRPVPVSGLTKVTSLAAGWMTTYAVRANGTVWDWGFGLVGELGYQSSGYSAVPGQVKGFGAPIAYVEASTTSYSEQANAVAVARNGTLWGPWGGQGSESPGYQITRVPALRPATGFFMFPFGGIAWGYGGRNYIAN